MKQYQCANCGSEFHEHEAPAGFCPVCACDLDVRPLINRFAGLTVQEDTAENKMREALEAVEWFEQKNNFEAQCPWCWNFISDGHAPDCQRQAALGVNTNTQS